MRKGSGESLRTFPKLGTVPIVVPAEARIQVGLSISPARLRSTLERPCKSLASGCGLGAQTVASDHLRDDRRAVQKDGQDGMADQPSYTEVIQTWWDSLPRRSRGNIAGGLVLIDNLRSNFDLDIESHKTEGSDQLRNASRHNVQAILARFGEERVLLKEGGRTNRGLVKNLTPLLSALSDFQMDRLSPEERDVEFETMQRFLADRARDIFNADKISFDYRSGMTSRSIIGGILESGRERRKAGEVAEHLVGAKLALRFPDYDIRNSAVSSPDDQTKERGDFQINDCVFHVTVSPNAGHYDKCQNNLADGLRVFLLVPDVILVGTRQNADLHMEGASLGRIHRIFRISEYRRTV